MGGIRDIGVVGLGNMGGRIARRIAGAGFALTGFDVSAERVAEAPVAAAGSPAEVAGRAEVVFLSLPDSTVVERVVYGDDGVAAGCRAGQIVVDLSTADPASSRRIHDDLALRDVAFVDAGISGGAAAAEKGTLTIMAGGPAEAVAAIEDVLGSFAERVFHMGDSGSGHVTKLLNNFLNGMSLAATAEVMVAGKKAGLDLDRLLEVLNSSSGVNFATLNRFPKIVHGDYLEGGLTCNLQAKDIQLYLGLLRSLEVTSLTGPPALAAFHLANALGYGEEISNRVVDAIGDLAGAVRIQQEAHA
jgi:3-hydroxyisobutyrate dehydrogenase-like beta-hydroxyacid dehydrogenase